MHLLKTLLFIIALSILTTACVPVASSEHSGFEFNTDSTSNSATQGTDAATVNEEAPVISESSPWGDLNQNINVAVLSVKTDVAAFCRYDKQDRKYNLLMFGFGTDADGKLHTASIMAPAQKAHKYFVKCRSYDGAENNISTIIEFTTMAANDTQAPMISAALPSGVLPATNGTTVLSVISNEVAQCRYDMNNVGFAQMAANLTASANGLSHSKQINIQADRNYLYFVSCQDAKGNATLNPSIIQFTVSAADAQDKVAPILSNLMPAGELATGTTQALISLSTNEASTCRYSNQASAGYAQMMAMQSSGSLMHSNIVSGLMNGQAYQYFVLCADSAGNISMKQSVAFNVKAAVSLDGAALYATSCQGCHNPLLNSNVKNKTALEIQKAIDENKGGMLFLKNQLSTAQVAAIAAALDTGAAPAAPILGGLSPFGNLAENIGNVVLTVSTNTASTCRYGTVDMPYASLTGQFNSNGAGSVHSATVQTVAQVNYTYYVKCRSLTGGINMMSSLINFATTIKADIEAPMISNALPGGTLPSTTLLANLRVTTNEKSECKYDVSSKPYAQMANELTFSGDKLQHSRQVAVQEDMNYNFFVSCSDELGNATITPSQIVFNVAKGADVVAPLLSGFLPGGELPEGTTQTIISLSTTENAVCRYATIGATPYAQMSAMGVTGALDHNTAVNGLQAGMLHNYYVLCADPAGNISQEGKIAFTVKAPAILDGAQLYATNCMGCHGGVPVAQSPKKNRTAAQIQGAINNNTGNMGFLSTVLSPGQIDAIAAALAASGPAAPTVTLIDNAKMIVGTRRYIASKMMTIFSAGNDTAKTRIEDRVLEDSNGFLGGTCTAYEDTVDCPGTSESSKIDAPMLPNVSSIRRGIIFNACGEVLVSDTAANTALTQAGLNATSSASAQNARKLADVFFPGIILSTEAITEISSLHQASRDQNLSELKSWKMVMLSMCQSSLFEGN